MNTSPMPYTSTQEALWDFCKALGFKKQYVVFTTAFHTDWVNCWKKNFDFGSQLASFYLKFFYCKAHMVMCATPSLIEKLKSMKCNVAIWGRGVYFELFDKGKSIHQWLKPVWLYVGRISVEKNIKNFWIWRCLEPRW